MNKGLKNVCIGVFIIIIDINIKGINLLPDFIGYFVIIMAMQQLLERYNIQEIKNVKYISIVSIIANGIAQVMFHGNMQGKIFEVVGLVGMIAVVYIGYYLYEILLFLANDLGIHEKEALYIKGRFVFIIIGLVQTIIYSMQPFLEERVYEMASIIFAIWGSVNLALLAIRYGEMSKIYKEKEERIKEY